MTRHVVISAALSMMLGGTLCAQNERERKVRDDRARVEEIDFWIYNDLEAGFAEAKRTGRPLLVTFRCIPCEACSELDAEVVERDPAVRDLLDKFVCVRVVHANGVDLSLFQYDYDQSWAAFMLNADKTIYGRYGTRSHQRESHNDVSIEGFARALEGALELHADFDKHRAALAAKTGSHAEIPVPEQLPALKGKYGARLDYEGNVVQSCIHCHMVGEALRSVYLERKEPIPDKLLYPYPHPKQFGLIMDPATRSTIKDVVAGSFGADAGFQAGDEIVSLDGQPILSTADIQWVLQQTGDAAKLKAEVRRGDQTVELQLDLQPGWRAEGDISWRVSSWMLRRIGTGGLVLETANDEQRRNAGVEPGQMALHIRGVGQYGAHAAGKRAGFQQGDIIVKFDGRTDLMDDSAVLAYVVNNRRAGDTMPVTIVRGGERKQLQLPVQD